MPTAHHLRLHAQPTRRTRLGLAALAATTLLAGCGLGERFQSPEDRINRLVPPALALRNAVEQLAATPETASGDNAAIDSQRKARMKLRALSCARDVTPRWLDSDASLLPRLSDKACFTAADQDIARWLGLLRVGRILAQGPLRAIPAQLPPMIASSDLITTMAFADHAGVAMLGGSSWLATVDIGTGSEIWRETRVNGMGLPALSPNGRLFRGFANGVTSIRAADSGETLAEFSPRQNFAWLDARYLVSFDTQKNSTELLELATGRQVPILGVRQGLGHGMAVPVPGAPDRFVLMTPLQAYQVEIGRADGQLQARLIAEQSGGPGWGNINTMALSTDGLTAVDGSQALSFLSLKDLSLQKIPLEPMRPQSALPTAQPDEFLVSAYAPNGDGGSTLRHFLLSRGAQTLAAIEPDPALVGRYVWIAPLKSLGVVNDRRITVVGSPKAGMAKSIGNTVSEVLDEMNRRKLAGLDSAATGQPPGAAPGLPGGAPFVPPVPDAPMAGLAADALIEGVGVYQGTAAVARPGQPRPSGSVDVRVRRSSKPIVLVLSSYEPVRWNVVPESGARIAVVLVSGYYTSSVVGAGAARVVQIGQDYAYSRDGDGFPRLQRAVAKSVGRPIGMFQSRYEGTSFSVGGP